MPAKFNSTIPSWMTPDCDAWEQTIFRSIPEGIVNLESLRTGDIDGDGRTEIVAGGDGALIWYRAHTAECGVIGRGHHGVAIALEDIDGDGMQEVVSIRERQDRSNVWQIVAYKAPNVIGGSWQEWILVPEADSEAHDIAFVDLDGDGVTELIADAPYGPVPATLAYKRGDDHTAPWTRHELIVGIKSEAVAVADLTGDGRVEIVHGPDWYSQPGDGPFSGPWKARQYAPSFREMGRVALFDITGDGTLDIICSEAEYADGRLSWFENNMLGDPARPWVEHPLDWGLYFAHSLAAWRDPSDGDSRVLVGEMAHGGYSAPRNWQSRLLEYRIGPNGAQRQLVSKDAGTHEATVADVDDDGQLEIVGKNWREPSIQIWRRRSGPSFASNYAHRLIDRDKQGAARAIVAFDLNGNGQLDVLCGSTCYSNPDWEGRELPGVSQVLGVFEDKGFLATLTGGQLALVSLGNGDWTYETLGHVGEVAELASIPAASEDPPAVVVGTEGAPLQLFQRSSDGVWSHRQIADVDVNAGITVADLDGTGRPGLLLGTTWMRNDGGGRFTPVQLRSDLDEVPLRTAIGDLYGDGSNAIVVSTKGPDVTIHGDEDYDYRQLGRIVVLRRSSDDPDRWEKSLVDSLREPRSLALADVDGDGELEIICGEHDPSWQYRSQARLYVYKRADAKGRTWTRHTLDDRFEHDRGPCVFEVEPGRVAIASHGTSDPKYVHMWEPVG